MTECPYCGEEFSDEHKKGVHISEKHVDSESTISKPKRDRDPYDNLVDDWKNRDKAEGKA